VEKTDVGGCEDDVDRKLVTVEDDERRPKRVDVAVEVVGA
jgi:hypothetical protein